MSTNHKGTSSSARSQKKFLSFDFIAGGVFFTNAVDAVDSFTLTLPETLFIVDPISTAAGLVMVVITLVLVQKKADSKPPRQRPPRRKRNKTPEKVVTLEEARRLRDE